MELLIAAFPIIARIAFWLLETYFANTKQDADSRRIFLELAEKLREKGIKGIRSRFESESQIGAGEAEWDKRETKQP